MCIKYKRVALFFFLENKRKHPEECNREENEGKQII